MYNTTTDLPRGFEYDINPVMIVRCCLHTQLPNTTKPNYCGSIFTEYT